MATGLESVDQLPQQRRAGTVCGCGGVGGCLQVLPGIPVREPLRASVSS